MLLTLRVLCDEDDLELYRQDDDACRELGRLLGDVLAADPLTLKENP